MSRPVLFALIGAFLLSGLTAAVVGGAMADTGEVIATPEPTEVVRCSLQPRSVEHPSSGAHVMILERTC